MRPMKIVRTIPHARTLGSMLVDKGQRQVGSLTKVIFCHNCQLLKKTPSSDAPKPIAARGLDG